MDRSRSLLLVGFLLTGLACSSVMAEPSSDAPWAFRTPRRPALPAVKAQSWVRNPIDAFILAKLEAKGLTPSSQADKLMLLRRVTFDLTGLPSTIEEQNAFLRDMSPDAYAKVVDRLVASPRYGEHWAQHWLDLVRYAESDGFKADTHRPNAYRYRDYVIKALNKDLPYDRFIQQQLAGDELEPTNPEAIIATGLNRLWPDEDNAANLEQRRQEILDDVTEVTGLVFMGLTMGCARCHDHKFDPILQSDYFRLQAFFAPMRERDDQAAAVAAAVKRHETQKSAWEAATKEVRAKMEAMVAAKREQSWKYNLERFRPEIQQAVLTAPEKRTPYQKQIALMADKQLKLRSSIEAMSKLTADQKKQFQEMEKQMNAARPKELTDLPRIMAISDIGREAPPTNLLAGGDWRKPRDDLPPGFPTFLGEPPTPDTRVAPGIESTGRRAALARWLTRKDHPLTARVMVNRLWQHHFGVGIVGTANDFGSQGEAPTHPELLDWLAVEFAEHGWSLKHMHRLMVTSATYMQTSIVDSKNAASARAFQADRENKLLWHARRRRLEGETIRDAMLAVTGELTLRMFGPSARPKLPDAVSARYAWKPDVKVEDQNRRSIYVLAKRNMRYPLFEAFDQPDLFNSCARRNPTTTSPQALYLLNSEFALERAHQWAATLDGRKLSSGNDRQINDRQILVANAYRRAWGRPATKEEIRLGLRFLASQEKSGSANPLTDFCHAVLNANEFLYVD